MQHGVCLRMRFGIGEQDTVKIFRSTCIYCTIYNYPTVTLSIESEKNCVHIRVQYTVAGSHIAQL